MLDSDPVGFGAKMIEYMQKNGKYSWLPVYFHQDYDYMILPFMGLPISDIDFDLKPEELIADISFCIEEIHSLGIEHRNINPDNIFSNYSSRTSVLLNFERAAIISPWKNDHPECIIDNDGDFNKTFCPFKFNLDERSLYLFEDDYESLMYTAEFLKTGNLPWILDTDGVIISQKKQNWLSKNPSLLNFIANSYSNLHERFTAEFLPYAKYIEFIRPHLSMSDVVGELESAQDYVNLGNLAEDILTSYLKYLLFDSLGLILKKGEYTHFKRTTDITHEAVEFVNLELTRNGFSNLCHASEEIEVYFAARVYKIEEKEGESVENVQLNHSMLDKMRLFRVNNDRKSISNVNYTDISSRNFFEESELSMKSWKTRDIRILL
jgi:serine/threonine protein kinase